MMDRLLVFATLTVMASALMAAQPANELSFILSYVLPQSDYEDLAGKGIGFGVSYSHFVTEKIQAGVRLDYVLPGEHYYTLTSTYPYDPSYTYTYSGKTSRPNHTSLTTNILFYTRDPFAGPSIAAGFDIGALYENRKRPTTPTTMFAPRVLGKMMVSFDMFLELGFRYVSTFRGTDNVTHLDIDLGASVAW